MKEHQKNLYFNKSIQCSSIILVGSVRKYGSRIAQTLLPEILLLVSTKIIIYYIKPIKIRIMAVLKNQSFSRILMLQLGDQLDSLDNIKILNIVKL